MTTPTALSLKKIYSGKVRDLYEIDDKRMLMVATDRLSAFDVILEQPIPEKGKILTAISNFWFDKLKDLVPNHFTGDKVEDVVPAAELPLVEGRAVVAKRLKPVAVEAIVRGYIVGSGWKEYQKSGTVCGIALPAGQQLEWKCIIRNESDPAQVKTWHECAGAEAVGHDDLVGFQGVQRIHVVSGEGDAGGPAGVEKRAREQARLHLVVAVDGHRAVDGGGEGGLELPGLADGELIHRHAVPGLVLTELAEVRLVRDVARHHERAVSAVTGGQGRVLGGARDQVRVPLGGGAHQRE